MDISTLKQSGLTLEQAMIYAHLLKKGAQPARNIGSATRVRRTLTYHVLKQLEDMGLVRRKKGANNVLRFESLHPSKLMRLAEQRERQARDAQDILSGVMEHLVSQYNLTSRKPGVLFYEGKEAIKRVTEDSLSAKKEILSYTDNEAIHHYLPTVNKSCVAKRKKLGIKKKMLTIDCAFIRKNAGIYDPSFTEIRVIEDKMPFNTAMQIYNDTVSYLTLGKDATIGVIIYDPKIAGMHKVVFNALWETAEKLI